MKAAFISQYRAGLKMLAETIEKCPDDLWEGNNYGAAYWRIVYHALFYTAFYLSESVDTFIPWEKHLPDYNQLGTVNHENKPVVIATTYTKAGLLSYAQFISENLEEAVNRTNEGDESGFPWIPMDKFELHLYNIRHLQHHIGQLIERLHHNGISGINWVGRVK
ncbi:MAG: hypothetical protein V4577_06510 [Bacteroidota bacterium]